MPLPMLSPRLRMAPTAVALRWRIIAAMTALTVLESPDVHAARSRVAMPALLLMVEKSMASVLRLFCPPPPLPK